MKLAMIVIGIIILLFFTIGAILKYRDNKKTEKDVLKFIKENPDKASVFAYLNGEPLLDYQSNKKMPLASILKVIIAIEFARQVELEKIESGEFISLKELDKYYIPDTDGEAHNDWLESLKGENLIENDNVQLIHIAKGMIQFSSNANMEYLMERLGIDNINKNLEKIPLSKHDALFPISSAILIGMKLKLEEKLTMKQELKMLKEMSDEEYAKKANEMHELLKNDREKQLIDNIDRKAISQIEIQLVQSQKQPKSTTEEYVKLMKAIRDRSILSTRGHGVIDDIMKVTPNSNSKLRYIGLKGGSSISILNFVFYSELKDGSTMDFAIFIHDSTRLDHVWLQNKLELFVGKFINEDDFQKETMETLNNPTF